jgi:DNA-3-methyladenine glycosylase II
MPFMPDRLAYTPLGPEARHLAEADPVLGEFIARIGPVEQRLETDLYASLAGSIVAQQLSDAAAATIWGRLTLALGGDTLPERVLAASDETMRGAGLSRSKLSYLRDLAQRVTEGSLDLGHIASLPDEDVIAELTAVRGIGRWTAEMFLIFSLGRPDVLALDDGALRATAGWLYGYGRAATREEVATLGERWAPYRTCASLYLWRGLALRREEQRASR